MVEVFLKGDVNLRCQRFNDKRIIEEYVKNSIFQLIESRDIAYEEASNEYPL